MNKWLKRIGIGILILLAIIAVATPLVGGFLIKQSVNAIGPTLLGVPVHLDSATLNPVMGHVALKGLSIGNPDGFKSDTLFKMANLDIKLRMRSLLGDKIIIEHILVSGPDLTYERGLKTSNIDRLMETLAPDTADSGEEAKPDKKKSSGKKVIIKELSINGIRVHVALTALGGHGFTLPLPPVSLSNIGGKEDGVTFGQAIREILGAIFKSVGDAVTGSGKLIGSGAAAVGEGAGKAADAISDGADKTIEGIKNLLK